MTDLDRLDTLASAATPGPWRECGRDVDHDKMVSEGRNPGDACGLGCEVDGPPEAWLRGQFANHADAAYIAAVSPDVVQPLVARVRAAEAALEFIADWAHDCIPDDDDDEPEFYGFAAVEQQARAALATAQGGKK